MKKTLSLILVLAMCLSLCACSGDTTPSPTDESTIEATETTTLPEIQYYNVGDTVSTKLFSFTLDAAQLAIALNNTQGEDHGLAKEYNVEEDKNNPYVARTGHTYVAFTYTVENISRAEEAFYDDSFVSVIYKDNRHSGSMENIADMFYEERKIFSLNADFTLNGDPQIIEAGTWHFSPADKLPVDVGQKQTRKAYADFALEVDSLTDDFCLCVKIPGTNGEEEFIYYIPAIN